MGKMATGYMVRGGTMIPGRELTRSYSKARPGRVSGFVLLLALAAVLAARPGTGRGDESVTDAADDEKVLHDAGIATDAAGLIAFLRSQAPSQADRARLSLRITDLGSPVFLERERASQELTVAGRYALPLLRPALASTDLEVARRSARCVEAIEHSPAATLLASAARLAAIVRPAGAAEALVTILPWADDESAEEAVFQTLGTLALRDGAADSAVVSATHDREPLRRAAAGYVLGQAMPDQRSLALPLLNDPDPRVRFRTACGLIRGGDRAAVPALIALIEEAPPALAWRAEETLDRLGSDVIVPAAAGTDATARQRVRFAWDEWWRSNGDRIDLTRASRLEASLGLNLIVELDSANRGGPGRVWECGADGRPRWQITNLNRPIDARMLPNGRVLVAEHGPPRVSERERDGRVVWEFAPSGQPVNCQRLPNGNTFIATYNELLEVNRAKEVVFSLKLPTTMVFYCSKLRNGHLLYIASNNRVVELDATGKELSSISVEKSGGWASVDRLVSGNLLVALYNAKKVVEIDTSGQVKWQIEVDSPGHAVRLASGNTLVASIEGQRIMEFDRAGKEVWRQATSGRPFHTYRR
jgi:hypothetical protein